MVIEEIRNMKNNIYRENMPEITALKSGFLTTKNISKSRAKKTKTWDPLKITKQTHFLVILNDRSPYSDFFRKRCG